MELEKRFLPFCDHEYANREDNSFNCVDVADEYAVKFAEWIIRQDITSKGIGFYVNYIGDLVTTKELLELFKREYSETVA
jgi:hypothetical protein